MWYCDIDVLEKIHLIVSRGQKWTFSFQIPWQGPLKFKTCAESAWSFLQVQKNPQKTRGLMPDQHYKAPMGNRPVRMLQLACVCVSLVPEIVWVRNWCKQKKKKQDWVMTTGNVGGFQGFKIDWYRGMKDANKSQSFQWRYSVSGALGFFFFVR